MTTDETESKGCSKNILFFSVLSVFLSFQLASKSTNQPESFTKLHLRKPIVSYRYLVPALRGFLL